jgi:hypothetical protein
MQSAKPVFVYEQFICMSLKYQLVSRQEHRDSHEAFEGCPRVLNFFFLFFLLVYCVKALLPIKPTLSFRIFTVSSK